MTETKMQLEDCKCASFQSPRRPDPETDVFAQTGLDDLCVRFIINLPREELESVERICFQVEEAQWFYEDFIRPLDPALPSMSLKAFALRIFQHCPLMSQWSHYHHITAFSEFLAYKTRVPVRGAIMLNQDMDEVVLVKGWKKGANWSFPRGKINKDEKDLDCAIREVYEETGFDIKEAGLVKDEKDVKFIEITMREQHMRLYVFRGVPRDSHFEPRTRKEISKIEWYKLSDLPTLKKSKQVDQGFAVANANKFYMVAPFLHPLKKWIAHQKRLDPKVPTDVKHRLHEGDMSMDEALQMNNAGFTPVQTPVGMAAPSELPEVAVSQDASSHLKRLLNINNPVAAHEQLPAATPAEAPGFAAGKSNALLALLRNGSSNDALPWASNNDAAPPYRTNIGTAQQQRYLAPGLFPGFPQQAQSTGQSGQLPQFPPQPHHVPLPPHLVPPANIHLADRNLHQGPFGQGGLPGGQLNPSTGYGAPHVAPQQAFMQPHQGGPQRPGQYAFPPAQIQGPAPFQRTGDPQFSHSGQQRSQVQGGTVPPASKLPPPKLTSHSLALLNVFRDETPKTPKAHDGSVIAKPGNEPSQRRRPSQHQDYLLNLLRSPDGANRGPVELSGQPIPSAGKQILRQPRADSNTKPVRGARKFPAGEGETSATVLGPLDMPQFEVIGRSPGKKKANGRKNNKDRHTQTPASPVTILPRPQATEGPASAKAITKPTQTTQPYTTRANAVEAPRPFQPKILRRSGKPTSGDALPMQTKPDAEPQAGTETNFPRRPSQTAAQREALLSLFGKQSIQSNNLPTGQLNIETSAAKPAAASASVSPLSARNLPSGGPEPVPDGNAQSPSGNRVASPDNKAFLLGFLESVAKGNK